jgi:hypothetical protein
VRSFSTGKAGFGFTRWGKYLTCTVQQRNNKEKEKKQQMTLGQM